MGTETKNELPTLTVDGGKELSIADLQSQLKTAEVGESLNSDYLKFEDGTEYRLIFMGMTEMRGLGDKKNQMVPSVKLLDIADGKIKVNTDVVMVSTCQNLDIKGRVNVPLLVVSKGFKGGGAGEYRDLTINELKLK